MLYCDKKTLNNLNKKFCIKKAVTVQGLLRQQRTSWKEVILRKRNRGK